MIWLTWRQFRAQAIAAAAAVAIFAIILAATGPHLSHLYNSSGLAACRAPENCAALYTRFTEHVRAQAIYPVLYFAGIAVLLTAPGLMGIFWGAPLVAREIESGTFRLAWNQSITRTRWLAVKLTLITLAAMATAELITLMTAWWASPITRSGGFPVNSGQLSRFSPLLFASTGLTPLGYAAFAFTLGVTAGVLIRRMMPAMAVTLVVFTAVQLVMPTVVRPHLPFITPAHSTTAITASVISNAGFTTTDKGITVPVAKPGVLVIANQTVTQSGSVFAFPSASPCNDAGQQECNAWLATQHLRREVTYQPASRYWPFQWYETAIFAVLALLLGGLCRWRIHRLF